MQWYQTKYSNRISVTLSLKGNLLPISCVAFSWGALILELGIFLLKPEESKFKSALG
jgi:hypothetical protein